VTSKQFRAASAAGGAAALLTMGTLTVAFSDISRAEQEPVPPGPVTTSQVSTGVTITEEVAPEAPKTSAVVPPITTTPSENPPTAEQH
jgi:hypothetical protein